MAMSATIALGASTVTAGQSFAVNLTVSNSGGSPVNVTGIQPLIMPHGLTSTSVDAASGVAPLGPGMVVAVPNAGSLVFSWTAVANGPTVSGSVQYDVGAIVYSADGSVFSPTVAVVTVNAPTH